MVKISKTLAMRTLDAMKIAYTIHTYPEDIRDAVLVAQAIEAPADRVFKTLVVLSDVPSSRPMLVMLPACASLDERAFAREIGLKSVHMAPHTQAELLTGLKVGGISALALLNRRFAMYIDDSAHNNPTIYVSAGQRGIDVQLQTADLLRITQCELLRASSTDKK